MTEQSLSFDLGDVTPDARLAAGTRDRLWIIAHPLPQYGGTMDNNVVIYARDALQELGFATLRFDFRGVGRSTGAEANDDRDSEDLAQLFAQVSARPEAEGGVAMAGYSFGAWATLGALQRGATPKGVMLFSPPVDFLDFAGRPLPDLDCLVTVGDRDGFCALASFDRWWDAQAPTQAKRERHVLPGVDHFYGGAGAALREAITGFVG